MGGDHTHLKSVQEYGDSLTSDILEFSLTSFLDWGLLGVGAFFNVNIPTSGAYGGDQHRLRPVDDPRYTTGQAWEGFRSDWVWESGVEYARQPIAVSGVFVNGSFRPASGVGAYQHTVDYPRGRVLFTTPIPATSVVTAEFSYRAVRVVSADAPWFQALQYGSMRVDDQHFLQTGSGAWDVLADNRVQLPAFVVEPAPHVRSEPHELGASTRRQYQDIILHVLAETRWDRKQLHDIAVAQTEKTFFGIDKNRLLAEDRYPLTVGGYPASGAMTYPYLVQESGQGGYRWRSPIRIMGARSEGFADLNSKLFMAQVRMTCEVYVP